MSSDPTWCGNSYSRSPSPCGGGPCAGWYNPLCQIIAASDGSQGVILSRLRGSARRALTPSQLRAGQLTDDVDADQVVRWNGSRWVSPTGQFIDIRVYGAVNNGNATQALIDALAAGHRNILFPSGFTFYIDNTSGAFAAQYVSIPAGTSLQFDSTIVSTPGKTISFDFAGDHTVFGRGILNPSRGTEPRLFLAKYGNSRFHGLTFKGVSTTDNFWAIVTPNVDSGTLDSIEITNCTFLNYVGYGYLREQANTSSHSVARTSISGCSFTGIYNGSAILLNPVAGKDRNIQIFGNQISGVYGDVSADPFSGFAIAIAGFNRLPFLPASAIQDFFISGNQISKCGSGIHVEYCANGVIAGNKIDDINSTYYKGNNGEGGIVVYGSSNWAAIGNRISNVTGDTANVWGIVARGGYSGGYQQSNKDFSITANDLISASMLLDQQVPSNAISGIPPYELTTSSRFDLDGNTITNGVCEIYSTGTLNVRDNDFVAPLATATFSVVSYYRNANVASLTVTLPAGHLGMTIGDLVYITGVGSGFDNQFAVVTGSFDGIATFTYSNAGANVGTTACTGTVYVMKKALMIDLGVNTTGNSDYQSLYRLNVTIEDNHACTAYGASSFSLRNLATSRYAGNARVNSTGNNFGFSASILPTRSVNRSYCTTNAAVPTGFEFAEGDEVIINLGAGATRSFCSVPGWVAPAGSTYAYVSAAEAQLNALAGHRGSPRQPHSRQGNWSR